MENAVRTGSIARRLLVFSAVFVSAALLVAVLILWLVMQTVMREEIDRRLDSQIDALEAALVIAPDGVLLLAVPLDGPPFDRPRSGWAWQIEAGGSVLASRSLGPRRLDLADAQQGARRDRGPPGGGRGPAGPADQPGRPRPADLDGPGGALHLRVATRLVDGRPVTIAAVAPQWALSEPAVRAITWLAPCMLALGLVLLAGTAAQVRYGLRPLRTMVRDLEAVGEGRIERLPDPLVGELRPLALKTNALLAQNEERLAATRLHFANLAHALKTPVASLSLALAEGNDPDGALRGLVGRIDQRIRHHLAAARRAMGGGEGLRTPLEPTLRELATIMSRLHADRPLDVSIAVDGTLAVACDEKDVEEMLGNLIDNAFKWARSRVALSAVASGRMVEIGIADDGPGIPQDRREAVLLPGVREDERIQGHGFGLTIVKELADLYGGDLRLVEATPSGEGLKACLTLPLARG
ncbi:sensor histidine kinase [Rhizobium sp. YIM 134829]|uniref:sensor histidine kinase n=1 Tax=Rhizobium sp. YIM 134829 TaxID=3390453 RepID=UPI0039799745